MTAGALVLAGLACASEAPAPPSRLELTGAALSLDDGTTVQLATATLGRDGVGQGTEAVASTPDSPPLDIHAPTSDWDLRARIARFTGGVTAVRGAVTLTCEVLTVSFSGPERVRVATAEGSVRVVQGERHATSERAELTADSGEIVLTGHPLLSEGANQMTGDRITLWLDDERVRCDACRLLVAGEAVRPK